MVVAEMSAMMAELFINQTNIRMICKTLLKQNKNLHLDTVFVLLSSDFRSRKIPKGFVMVLYKKTSER